MAIGVAVEESYYDALHENEDACRAVEVRDRARIQIAGGRACDALNSVNSSVISAESAVSSNPLFQRELYASLGRAAQINLMMGHDVTAYNTARRMNDMDLNLCFGDSGLDQYEIIFWPTIAAAMYSGSFTDRTVGAAIAVSGMAASVMAESRRFVSFPNRDEGFAWRVKKKFQFAGRNLVALGANVFGSGKLARLAVK